MDLFTFFAGGFDMTERLNRPTAARPPIAALLAAALALGAAAAPASASLIWDANPGVAGAQDGSGTWNTTNDNWWDGTTNVAYSGGQASFGAGAAGAYTVTLENNFTGQSALTFTTSGYTLQGDATRRTLSNTGRYDIVVASGVTATLGDNLTVTSSGAGNPNVAIGGAGTLNLASGAIVSGTGTNGQVHVGEAGSGKRATVNVQSGATLSSARIIRFREATVNINGTVTAATTGSNNAFILGQDSTGTDLTNVTVLNVGAGATVTATTTDASRPGIQFSTNALHSGGILNLNGGTLTTSAIRAHPDAVTDDRRRQLNFNGGELIVASNAAEAQRLNFIGGFRSDDGHHRASILAGGANINTNGFNDVTITSALFGSEGGDLTKLGGGTLILAAQNTYDGDTVINAGGVTLASTGALRFFIEDAGVSNRVTGTGSVTVDGTFMLDVSALTDEVGTWDLVNVATLNETFGDTFGVAFVDGPAFDDVGGGVYTSGDWSFDTATGNLTLIPEPASLALLGLGGLLMLRRR
jgi:autotransporter-associated beta strand protein